MPPTASSRPSWSARSATSVGRSCGRDARTPSEGVPSRRLVLGRSSWSSGSPRASRTMPRSSPGPGRSPSRWRRRRPTQPPSPSRSPRTSPCRKGWRSATGFACRAGSTRNSPRPWLSPRSSGSTIPPIRSGGTTPRCSMARSRASASRPTGPSSRRASGSGHARRPRPRERSSPGARCRASNR